MATQMTAVEVTGTIDKNHQLRLDTPLAISGPVRVRVIVLYPLEEEMDETEWLYAAAHNPAFAFLKEPEEDIYTIENGKPFNDKV